MQKEVRKIQHTGGSSYTVTLPKNWIIANKLEVNRQVEMEVFATKTLIINPIGSKKDKTGHLTITRFQEERLTREIISLYISGVDEILISSQAITSEQRLAIRRITHKLIGFELFFENSSQILLKSVVITSIPISEYITKMVEMVVSMYFDVLMVVQKHDKILSKDIEMRDIEIDRIHLLIIREFKKSLSKALSDVLIDPSLIDLNYFEHVAIRLERIADHIVSIALEMNKEPQKQEKLFNKFEFASMKKTAQFLDELKKIIFAKNIQNTHRLMDDVKLVKNANDRLQNETKTRKQISIAKSNQRICSYIENILEETLNYIYMKRL